VQHLAVGAAHRDLVAGALECLDWRGYTEEGHGFLVLLRLFICADNGGVSQVYQYQVALVGHHVLARQLFVRRALREGELLARYLLLLRARATSQKRVVPSLLAETTVTASLNSTCVTAPLRGARMSACANVNIEQRKTTRTVTGIGHFFLTVRMTVGNE